MGLVAGWLTAPENAQWLSFGPGVETLSPVTLKMMGRRDTHALRLFSADGVDAPIGLVALSDVDRRFRTAMLWYALGDAGHGGRGYTSRAVSMMLTEAFSTLGIEAVSAWAVRSNIRSIRVLERNHFRFIGQQRRCHRIDGVPQDRLLFDLIATEHEERT
ncbi:MAG: GNAT family protein [Minicystis sp.]